MSTNKTDVLIIGAGPVGLFCANEMARQGLQCRIVEKKSFLSEKSKALGIHIRSLDLFADCGFIDEIFRQGLKVEGLCVKSKGREIIDADFKMLSANYNFLIDLPQNKTEAILYQGLQQKGLEVEWNKELTAIEPHSDHVLATLNGTEQVSAQWVIACDGPHSMVRSLLNIDFIGASFKQTWWLADLIADGDLAENKMTIYLSDEGPLAFFPMGNKRYRLGMTALEKIEYKTPNLEDIEEVLRRRCSDKVKLSDPIWISQFGIANKEIRQFRHERVFFAGDAAHIHSPLGGQGLNTGLQDIYNLAWKLALVQKGLSSENLLDSYQLERYPIAKNILQKTGFLTRMIMLSNPLLIHLRNQLMRFLMSFESLKMSALEDIAELKISYAKSPIVSILGKKTAFSIGEFLTDFSLISEQSKESKKLQEIVQGCQHHLFLFAGTETTQLDSLYETALAIEEQYKDLIKTHLVLLSKNNIKPHPLSLWLDTNQEVHKKYSIREATILMLRPDKYIGLTQAPLNKNELLHHLEKGYIKIARNIIRN